MNAGSPADYHEHRADCAWVLARAALALVDG